MNGRISWTTGEALVQVEALMELLIGSQDPCAVMAAYHMATGGKRIRGRLALDSALALGVDPSAAVAWAAACELMHNASLVHDDLQDGDTVRRGRQALWVKYGREQAINAGDLLLMLPFVALDHAELPPAVHVSLTRCLARHGQRTVRGQSDEMTLRSTLEIDATSYLRAAEGKTAGLFGMPVEGAALMAGYSPEAARELALPFERLGLLYQLQDDVIDCFGNKERGEPGGDIREGKVSALTVAHVQLHPEERGSLVEILSLPRGSTPPEVVSRVIERFLQGGAVAAVLDQIDQLGDLDGVLTETPMLRAIAVVLRDLFLAPLEEARRLVRELR